MYVVTDGLSGLTAGPDTPGTGHNFLVHNMCRLPGSDGTWMVAEGGMGAVSAAFAETAARAGATLATSADVTSLLVDGGTATGVVLADGRSVAASAVLAACDPWRTAAIAGTHAPAELTSRLAVVQREGTTLKLNMALRALPTLAGLPEDAPTPWGATVHLLPDATGRPLEALRRMWRDVEAGRLPEFPTMEWYVHTAVDPSLQDPAGHHSSALFVQSVPYRPAEASWDDALEPYVAHLLTIADQFAPGTSDLVADSFALSPPGIEQHFGITGGHIHHVDNAVAFADRIPYATGLPGLYAGSAGCHPAGSVIGAAGWNSAYRVLADLDG
jgi:phytoene dehydrogenase-like protein